MSNYDSHTMAIFQDDLETVKEYLKIAINTIFFNRWLTNNNYICEKSVIKDISYMKINDDSLQKDIDNILGKITSQSQYYKKFQINIDFYERNQGIFLGFFQKKKNCWEKWNILVIISEQGSIDKEMKMRNFISMIMKHLNTDKDFMPDINLEEFENYDNFNKINESNSFNFPYEMNVRNEFEQNSMVNLFNNGSFNIINNITY